MPVVAAGRIPRVKLLADDGKSALRHELAIGRAVEVAASHLNAEEFLLAFPIRITHRRQDQPAARQERPDSTNESSVQPAIHMDDGEERSYCIDRIVALLDKGVRPRLSVYLRLGRPCLAGSRDLSPFS